MKDPRIYKWLPKFVKVENQLNELLREAAKDGVKPAIRIYEDAEKLGKDVQSVEVSLVLGNLTPCAPDKSGAGSAAPAFSEPESTTAQDGESK